MTVQLETISAKDIDFGRPPNHDLVMPALATGLEAAVVAKVIDPGAELVPRVGFIVTNLSRSAERHGSTISGAKRSQGRQEREACRATRSLESREAVFRTVSELLVDYGDLRSEKERSLAGDILRHLASGHRQLTRIGLQTAANSFQWRCNQGIIAINLRVIWEMSVK